MVLIIKNDCTYEDTKGSDQQSRLWIKTGYHYPRKSNVLNILNVQKREIDLNSNKGNANEWEIWGIRKVLTYFVVHSTKQ